MFFFLCLIAMIPSGLTMFLPNTIELLIHLIHMFLFGSITLSGYPVLLNDNPHFTSEDCPDICGLFPTLAEKKQSAEMSPK